MIKLKSNRDLEKIRESGIILARTLARIVPLVAEGVSTGELDEVAREYILSQGAKPAFLGYMGYPATLCTAVNYEVIHGIPGKRKLKNGDIVGLDIGVNLDGYFSDACVSVGVGELSPSRERLLKVTRECLDLAIAQVVPGNRISDIARAVYNHAIGNGYEVVRDFCGHGVGFSPHEDPQVPNYLGRGPNPRLKPGMVLAIEPMINEGTSAVRVLEDGWTVETMDKRDSGHFEHTVAVTKDGPWILTLPE